MSLRTTFTGALDAKLAQARQAGYDFVTITNLTQITADITNAANQGKKKFTLSYAVTYQPQDLRLLGPLWRAFQTGVVQAMASEEIMLNEVVVKLNTNDQLTTKIDLEIDFCGQ